MVHPWDIKLTWAVLICQFLPTRFCTDLPKIKFVIDFKFSLSSSSSSNIKLDVMHLNRLIQTTSYINNLLKLIFPFYTQRKVKGTCCLGWECREEQLNDVMMYSIQYLVLKSLIHWKKFCVYIISLQVLFACLLEQKTLSCRKVNNAW